MDAIPYDVESHVEVISLQSGVLGNWSPLRQVYIAHARVLAITFDGS